MSTDSQSDRNERSLACPHCGGDVGAGRHFTRDALGRVHCSDSGRVVSQEWVKAHDLDLPDPPEADVSEQRGSSEDRQVTGPHEGSPARLDPLGRVLSQHGLDGHPAGEVAQREARRKGGTLGPAELDEILRTADIPAGQRRLAVREYSSVIGGQNPDPFSPGAAESAGDRRDSGGSVGELVEALDQLDQVRSRESRGPETVAEAVGEAVAPALESLAQGQQQIAAALSDEAEPDEVTELRQEIAELREEQRKDEIEELRERVEQAERTEGGFSTDPSVAELELADRTAERVASKMPESDELLAEVRELARELSIASAYGQPPSGENAPRPTPPGYTPPEQRDEQQAAGAVERDPSGTRENTPPDTTAVYGCSVCGREFNANPAEGHPSCPECGDASPNRLDEAPAGSQAPAGGAEGANEVSDMWEALTE